MLVPKWVWAGLLLPLVVFATLPGARDYVKLNEPVPVNDAAILKLRIEEAAGGTVTLVSLADDGTALIWYEAHPDDWGVKLGEVMAGIAQAGADGVELGGVMLTYEDGGYGLNPGRVTVGMERIVGFINGDIDEADFNYRMLHTGGFDSPTIVRPGASAALTAPTETPAPLTDEALIALRIQEVAGGEVKGLFINADRSTLMVYLNDPDDWGTKLGEVVAGIAQARREGADFGAATVIYQVPATDQYTGIMTVDPEVALAFIDGTIDEAAFNDQIVHIAKEGQPPLIVRPG